MNQHSYQGRLFSEKELQFLKANFYLSYQQSILKNSHLEFIRTYGKDDSIISKTYSEFDLDVRKTIQHLFNEPLDYEILVTIDGNRYEHLVLIVAGLLLGLQVAPMSPNDTPERIHRKISALGSRTKTIKDFRLDESGMPANWPWPTIHRQPEDPFILIFTSGTTGHSKVVQQTEQGLLCNVDALISHHQLGEQRKTIATALPASHVNALEFSFMVSLLGGQRLILFEAFDVFQTLQILQSEQISIYSGIPFIYKTIFEQKKRIGPKGFGQLEYFVSAASALSPDFIRQWNQTFTQPILQGYGLSEAINFSLMTPIDLTKEELTHFQEDFLRPTVGIQLHGNEVHILDENSLPCKEGQSGEICIRGFNLMAGYLGEAQGTTFQDGLFRTGDLGFYTISPHNEKYFFVSGRLKDVIKRFGYTVSLQEIDDYLMSLDLARLNAVAVGFENDVAGEEVGIAVTQNSPLETLEALKTLLIRDWPAHLRPRVILQTLLPLRTESGKSRRWPLKHLFDKYKAHQFKESVLIDLQN